MENKIKNRIISNIIQIKLILFLFIFLSFFKVSNSSELNNAEIKNEILITIQGKYLKILNEGYNIKPIIVLLNGYEVNIQDNEIQIPDSGKNSINNVTMKWNRTVEDCSYMFYNLTLITYIDLSKFDFSLVTSTVMMFGNCLKLQSITFPDNINENNNYIRDMSYMFYNCKALNSIDLSSLYLNYVINLDSIFYNCNILKYLNLENINTINTKNMSYMFYECNILTSLNLSNFNTINVLDMQYMF